MKMDYEEWILKNVEGDGYLECEQYSAKMAADFPELTRVRGHYFCLLDNILHPHWWLVDQGKKIIDPTRQQFPCRGNSGYYIEHNESDPEPTGKCPNCSGCCYDNKYCCCEQCEKEYVAYCNNPFDLE